MFEVSIMNRAARALAKAICDSDRFRPRILAALTERHASETIQELVGSRLGEVLDATVGQAREVEHALRSRSPELRRELFLACCAALQSEPFSPELLTSFTEASGASLNYAQEGEDILLSRFLKKTTPGFFVDIGAHHPIRFSNTYALYLAGWRGINVDATPGSMELFRKIRSEDINIECAVSDDAAPLRFHLFAEGALNTGDATLAERYACLGWEPSDIVEVMPRTLVSLLEEHLPADRTIDLMSIDVENAEMNVLRSSDWERFRPAVLVIEALDTSLASLGAHPAIAFLREHRYTPVSKLINSVILRAED